MRSVPLLLVGLAACSPLGPCSSNVEPGSIAADVDGASWASTATYRVAGSSLQVNAEPSEGWFMNFVLQTTIDGDAGADALAGTGDLEFDLADGGFATLYEDGAGSYRSDTGTVRVLAYGGTSLTACFAYTTGGDRTVDVHRGSVNATFVE